MLLSSPPRPNDTGRPALEQVHQAIHTSSPSNDHTADCDCHKLVSFGTRQATIVVPWSTRLTTLNHFPKYSRSTLKRDCSILKHLKGQQKRATECSAVAHPLNGHCSAHSSVRPITARLLLNLAEFNYVVIIIRQLPKRASAPCHHRTKDKFDVAQ